MRFNSSIFTSLLKPIDRRAFKASVSHHRGDAYDKRFTSWDHLVTLLFAQFTGTASLRAIEAGFNALGNHHFHLGAGKVARSTLADANARRPAAVFSELFERLASGLGRKVRKEGGDILRLIDATPIPLSQYFDCAASNGRIRGLKLHVVHDRFGEAPVAAAVTPANVNDITFGRGVAITPGVTYVFDKGYCHFGWWSEIDAKGALFVTRPKTNMRWKTRRCRPIGKAQGDGFRVLADREVKLASRGDSKLLIFLRRITIKRDNGDVFDIISNDAARPAHKIALCYKARWDIELFFKWMKQNLNIRKFIAMNENAIRLQIFAAMIAFVLLSIARRMARTALSLRRFAELVAMFIHTRRDIAQIERPPPTNPSAPKCRIDLNQLCLSYA